MVAQREQKQSCVCTCRRNVNAEEMLSLLKVVDHYEKPRNVGSFDKKDLDVGTGLVGAPACGDVMKLQIRVRTKLLTAANSC